MEGSSDATRHVTQLVCGIAGGVVLGGVLGYLLCRHQHKGKLEAELQEAKDHYLQRADEVVHRSYIRTANLEAELEELRTQIPAVAPEDVVPAQAGTDSPLLEAFEAVREAVENDRELRGVSVTSEPDIELVGTAGRGRRWVDVVRDSVSSEPSEVADDGVEASAAVPESRPVPVAEVNRDPSRPYLISYEEFFEDRDDYQKIDVTYYAADNALVDNRDEPIRDIRGTVGDEIAWKFGGISKDPLIAYIRNERLEVDFEVTKDERSYAEVVLGYGNPQMVLKPKSPNGPARVVRQEE